MQIPFLTSFDSSARSLCCAWANDGMDPSSGSLWKTQQGRWIFDHHRAKLGIAQAQLTQLMSGLRDQIVGKWVIGLTAIAAQDHMRRSEFADRVIVLRDSEGRARADHEVGHKFDIRAEPGGLLHLRHAHVDRTAECVRRDDSLDALAPGFADDEQRFVG